MTPIKRLLLLTVLLGAVAGGYACSWLFGESWQPPQVVKIESSESVSSFFTSWGSWNSDAEEGAPQGLLLRDGDYVSPEHGDMPAPYRVKDGQSLKMTFNNWSARIGETTVSVLLNKEGLAWVDQASDRQLADLRLLGIPTDPDNVTLPALKRIAAVNPHVDLESESEATGLQVLPLFRPTTVFIGEHATAAVWAALANQPQLDTLIMPGSEPGSLDALPKYPHLRRLFLTNWDPEAAGPLPEGLTSLKTLKVSIDKSIKDLGALRNAPAGLEELTFVGMKDVSSLAGLEKLTNLRTLILKTDEQAIDLSSLASLKHLRWVALPFKTTQEQFAAFVSAHPDITFLDMMHNETVKDLAPLSSLKSLNGLILDGEFENLNVVQKLTSLRFVGVSKDIYDKSPEQIAAIRKALPDALVVRVSPFCLGSGWILLLVLVPLVAWWIRRRGSAHVQKAA